MDHGERARLDISPFGRREAADPARQREGAQAILGEAYRDTLSPRLSSTAAGSAGDRPQQAERANVEARGGRALASQPSPKHRREGELVIALAGQPNCGKSTLFNAVAGFKVDTGNFAGTSVSFSETTLEFEGRSVRLIDLPGTYSISSHDPAERVARDFLLARNVDVVINVVDASLLSRSLELTLQLVEMGIPMILCLNMMDEAQRKGVEIDVGHLSALLGLPVRPVVAVLGSGLESLFRAAFTLAADSYEPIRPVYDREVEESVARLLSSLPPSLPSAFGLDPRFLVLRLLEMDEELEDRTTQVAPELVTYAQRERRRLAEQHGWPESSVLASHRHAIVLDLYEKVATHRHRSTPGWTERIDRFIMNPLGGAIVVAGSLIAAFYLAFSLGSSIAKLVDGPAGALTRAISHLGPSLPSALLSGLSDGIIAGAGIVLPYLVPLLLLLAVYEDTGLLPRIAFLVDGVLHRVGLHGKSVVPLVLGFGCNVPAIMATRNLEHRRDRIITMLVIPFVTCSARSVVVLALAGRYLGAGWAAALYLLSIAVMMLVSLLVSRPRRHPSLGMVMEVPALRRPYLGIVIKKVGLRLREFLLVAWPVILVSSVALAVLSHFGMDGLVNRALSPLTTSALGLPAVVGIALFLGFFRKELTLVMLAAALGTSDIGAVLTKQQILVLVVFTTLYIPCLATLTTIWKEGGWRTGLASAALNLVLATSIAGLVARLPGLG